MSRWQTAQAIYGSRDEAQTLVKEIVRATGPMPDPEAHGRWLALLDVRSLRERLEQIKHEEKLK